MQLIRLLGPYNNRVHNRYKNKLPGDSPELMPLDCHLFSDIREGLARNVAYSFFLPKDDPDKYDASTPHKIFESIRRTIKNGCPSEERIIQDIDRISEVTLDRIIAAEGTFIEDDGKKSAMASGRPHRRRRRRKRHQR